MTLPVLLTLAEALWLTLAALPLLMLLYWLSKLRLKRLAFLLLLVKRSLGLSAVLCWLLLLARLSFSSGFDMSFGLETLEQDKEIVKAKSRFLEKESVKAEAQSEASEAKALLENEKAKEREYMAVVSAAQAELDRVKAMRETKTANADSKAFTEKAMAFIPVAVAAVIGIVTIAIFGRGK